MLSARFKPWHVPLFLAKYAYLTVRRRPVLVHFEVTMRCNARCGEAEAPMRLSRVRDVMA